jgi:hypothetical protein
MSNQIKDCPICGSPIPNREHAGQYSGAISRMDNKTEICSDCGVQEALNGHFIKSLNLIMDAINPNSKNFMKPTLESETKIYTVDVKVRVFVEAQDASRAMDIAHEACLGNDPHDVLGTAEVGHIDEVLDVQEGFFSLIEH